MSKHFPPWFFDEPDPIKEKKFKDKMIKQFKKNSSNAYWHPTRICWNCHTSLVICTNDGWCMCENCGEDCGLE